MTVYKCARCDKEFDKKQAYEKHLIRKFPCKEVEKPEVVEPKVEPKVENSPSVGPSIYAHFEKVKNLSPQEIANLEPAEEILTLRSYLAVLLKYIDQLEDDNCKFKIAIARMLKKSNPKAFKDLMDNCCEDNNSQN